MTHALRSLAESSLAPLLVALSLTGCATTGPPEDPYQGMNRQVYAFNNAVDEAVLKPVAQGYQAIVPDFVDEAISNFFRNLADVQNAINNILQLKVTHAFEDVGRMAINSTIGVAGLFDIASGIASPSTTRTSARPSDIGELAQVPIWCCRFSVRAVFATPSAPEWISSPIRCSTSTPIWSNTP